MLVGCSFNGDRAKGCLVNGWLHFVLPPQKMLLLYLVLYVVLGVYVKYFLCRKVTSKGILMYTKVDLFHFLCSVLSPLR